MTLWSVLAVALGGALGTLGRVGADLAAAGTPWGNEVATLGVNLLGALALGLCAGHGLASWSTALREGLTIGVLGAYTTMSGVALIAATSEWRLSLGYLALTVGLGVSVAVLGYRVGRLWAAKSSRELRQ